jgi:hypothetical protein
MFAEMEAFVRWERGFLMRMIFAKTPHKSYPQQIAAFTSPNTPTITFAILLLSTPFAIAACAKLHARLGPENRLTW